MKETLLRTVRELLDSKKAVATIAAVIALATIKAAGHYGIAIDQASADSIADRLVVLATSYVVGQGIADHGKAAA